MKCESIHLSDHETRTYQPIRKSNMKEQPHTLPWTQDLRPWTQDPGPLAQTQATCHLTVSTAARRYTLYVTRMGGESTEADRG